MKKMDSNDELPRTSLNAARILAGHRREGVLDFV